MMHGQKTIKKYILSSHDPTTFLHNTATVVGCTILFRVHGSLCYQILIYNCFRLAAVFKFVVAKISLQCQLTGDNCSVI
jgi:hypothetical protein